jgi:hypothetical protein
MSEGNRTHAGRPRVYRLQNGGTMILCPIGHVIETVRPGDWAGSRAEARYGNPDCIVTCGGTQ